MHSRVTREELLQLHSQADIFVFPTLFEGSSLALLEAMASALPIVTTPVGAAPDILQDQTSAMLVSPRDSALLAAAVRRLIENPAMRGTLGAKARAAAEAYRSTSVLCRTRYNLKSSCLIPRANVCARSNFNRSGEELNGSACDQRRNVPPNREAYDKWHEVFSTILTPTVPGIA